MAKEKKLIPFVLLDDTVTTYGFRILTDGVDITQFERNPVMLSTHNDTQLPIGRWVNIRKEKGKILADAEFDYDDPSEEVQRLFGKVEREFIKMASSAVVPLEWSNDESLKMEGQTLPTLIRGRMREASIVNIGGNNNSLRFYDQDGTAIDLNDTVKLSDMIRPKQINKSNMSELNTLLKLGDTATDVQITDAVKLLLSDNKELTDKVAAFEQEKQQARKQEAVKLVDAAVSEGRIDATGKDTYLALFDKDFDGAKTALASIPKRASVTDVIDHAKKSGQNATELADLSAKSWDELDKADRLITLRDSYPEEYKKKYKEKYGVEPVL